MTKSRKGKFAGLLGILLLTSLPAGTFAQDGHSQKTVSLDFHQVDVRKALKSLFKLAGASYIMSSDVQGTISVSANNAKFDTALDNVLHQISATFEVEDGIYEIDKQTQPPVADVTVAGQLVTSFDANQVDVRGVLRALFAKLGKSYTIAPEVRGPVTLSLRNVSIEVAVSNILRQVGAAYQIEGGVYEIVKFSPVDTGPALLIPSLEANQADVRALLSSLFDKYGISYQIDPTVQGAVTISLKNVTFETALTNILCQVGASYRVIGGTYIVLRSDAPTRSVDPADRVVHSGPKTPPSITMDGDQVTSLEAAQADVRQVFRMLFKKAGKDYSIAPEVLGRVTLRLKNVTFDEALANVARQVDATYRIEGGVYEIVKRDGYASSGPSRNVPMLEVSQADVRGVLRSLFQNLGVPYSIAPDVQGMVTISLKNMTFENALTTVLRQVDATYRVVGGKYQIIKMVSGVASDNPSRNIIPSLEFDQADARSVLQKLFMSVNASYTIDAEVQGTISLSLKNVTFESALRHILRNINATYRIEDGVYRVFSRTG